MMQNCKKSRNILLILSLVGVFLAIIDMIMTYIVTPDLHWEASPLARNFGWSGMIIGQILITAVYAACVYFVVIKYSQPQISCSSFREYLNKSIFKIDHRKPEEVKNFAMLYVAFLSVIFIVFLNVSRFVAIVE